MQTRIITIYFVMRIFLNTSNIMQLPQPNIAKSNKKNKMAA